MTILPNPYMYPDSDAVYDILVATCGAYDSADKRKQFRCHWPECVEYRFQGDLGFGGKVWALRGGLVQVTCHSEDENDTRRAMIQRANEILGTLVQMTGRTIRERKS